MKDIAAQILEAVVTREARVRQGKVVSFQGTNPRTITVNINGVNQTDIIVMDHVFPVVGSGVWMVDMGIGRWFCFGTVDFAMGSFLAAQRRLNDNGDMHISQRGASIAGVSTPSNLFDRWGLQVGSLGVWTISQDSDVPAGTPFTQSCKYLCTTADASPVTTDYNLFTQSFEGQDLQHMLWGTSKARPLAVSFWVKGPVGQYNVNGLRLLSGGARLAQTRYNINVANTWEFKTVYLPGDTTSLTDNDSNSRLQMEWWLGAGATYNNGTALQSAWGTNVDAKRGTGNFNLAGTVNNTWRITGIQVEPDGPTPYEIRTTGDELRRCQRYYEETGFVLIERTWQSAAPGNPTLQELYHSGYWKVTKRTTPTITLVPEAGTGGHIVTFSGGFGSTQGFYQDVLHSVASNSLVKGNSEI